MKYRWPSILWMAFFSVGYVVTFLPGVPVIKYYPEVHAWGLAGAYPEPGMAWFYKVAVGCLVGAIGWTLGALIAKNKGPESRPPLAIDIAAWFLVCMSVAYTAHYEWVKWM